MEASHSSSFFQFTHSFCEATTIEFKIPFNINVQNLQKFVSLTQLSQDRFVLAVVAQVKSNYMNDMNDMNQINQMNRMNQINRINQMNGVNQMNRMNRAEITQFYNMRRLPNMDRIVRRQRMQQQLAVLQLKLILYYTDSKGKIIEKLFFEQNELVEIHPFSEKQVIMIIYHKKNNYYNSSSIKQVKLINFDTCNKLSFFDDEESMQDHISTSEVICFPQSKTFCYITNQDKTHINIKYYSIQSNTGKQLPIFTTVIQQKTQHKYVKGNNSSMIIWFTETVSRYAKFIEFQFFSLQKKNSKPLMLRFQKNQEMHRCELIQISKIVQVGYYKFMIFFVIDKKIRIFIYEAIKKVLRETPIKIDPTYSIHKIDSTFPHLVRLIAQYTPQKIFEPVVPLFSQQIPQIKQRNNSNKSQITKNPQYYVYYIDTAAQKIIVAQKLKIFQHCYHEYQAKFFNQYFYQPIQTSQQQDLIRNFQILVKRHNIVENGIQAVTHLILQYFREQIDDNFIIQALDLLGICQP